MTEIRKDLTTDEGFQAFLNELTDAFPLTDPAGAADDPEVAAMLDAVRASFKEPRDIIEGLSEDFTFGRIRMQAQVAAIESHALVQAMTNLLLTDAIAAAAGRIEHAIDKLTAKFETSDATDHLYEPGARFADVVAELENDLDDIKLHMK